MNAGAKLVLAFVSLSTGCGAGGALPPKPSSIPVPPAPSTEERDTHLSSELFPGNVPLDERGRPSHAVTRIVDARTGAPLPDARVQVVFERERPLAGEFWSTRTAEADDDGYVRVRLDDFEASPWLYFEAPGHATRAELTRVPDPVIALEPGLDVEIEVRDPWERPIAGASIGRIIGCGHTPDAAVACTDEHGRAVLRSVDTGHHELWPVAEGFESDYFELEPWLPGDPPLVLRLRYGAVVEGVVVDHDGKPVPRAFVGESRTHRGPWTQADEQGRFRLVGASATPEVFVFGETGAEPPIGVFSILGDGRPCTLVVPNLDLPRGTPVRIALHEIGTGIPAVEVPVVAVERRFRTATRATSGVDGIAVLELAPGGYEIHAGGFREGNAPPTCEEAIQQLEVGEAPLEAELAVVGLVGQWVTCDDRSLLEEVRVELATRDDCWDITEFRELALRRQQGSVRGPRGGALAIRVVSEERIAVTDLGEDRVARQGRGSWKKALLPAATIVRARLTRSGGAEASGFGTISHQPELDVEEARALRTSSTASDTLSLRTWRLGRRWLIVEPEDGDLLPLRIPIVLRESEAELDLGVLRFASRTEPSLVVLRADGTPSAGARVRVRRTGGFPSAELDARGALKTDLALRPGDRLSIEASDRPLPFEVELRGEAPWTLRWPAGAIEAAAADDDGQPLQDFLVLLDGASVESEGELAHLPGISAGPHRVIVTAPGRLAWIEDLELAEGATARVDAVLPRR